MKKRRNPYRDARLVRKVESTRLRRLGFPDLDKESLVRIAVDCGLMDPPAEADQQ
jgi:hypothetical protein